MQKAGKATAAHIGLTRKDIHEARIIRDASRSTRWELEVLGDIGLLEADPSDSTRLPICQCPLTVRACSGRCTVSLDRPHYPSVLHRQYPPEPGPDCDAGCASTWT